MRPQQSFFYESADQSDRTTACDLKQRETELSFVDENSDVCKNETVKKKHAVAYQKEREHILSVVSLCSDAFFIETVCTPKIQFINAHQKNNT